MDKKLNQTQWQKKEQKHSHPPRRLQSLRAVRSRLFLSIGWLICNIHRVYNYTEPVNISAFPLYEYPLTVQWYIFLLGVKVWPICILMASYYGIRQKDYIFMQAVLWLEVINYILCYSTSEFILAIQGLVILIMLIKKWK